MLRKINFSRLILFSFTCLLIILIVKNINFLNLENSYLKYDRNTLTVEECKIYPENNSLVLLNYNTLIFEEQVEIFPELQNLFCINKISKVELKDDYLLIYQYKNTNFSKIISRLLIFLFLITLINIKKISYQDLTLIILNFLLLSNISGQSNYLFYFYIYTLTIIVLKFLADYDFRKLNLINKFYDKFYKNFKIYYLLFLLFITFQVGGYLAELFVPEGAKVNISKQIVEFPQRFVVASNLVNNPEALNPVMIERFSTYIKVNEFLESKIIELNDANNSSSTVICNNTNKELSKCINANAGKTIVVPEGIYYSNVINVYSNTNLIITKNAKIFMSDENDWKEMCPTCKGGVGAVFRAVGTPEKPLNNIHILLNGEIIGSNYALINDYRYEGINFKYVEFSTISGDGSIKNIHGDGIDIDGSSNILVKNLSILNNSGTGVHLGSPRPITSNSNIIVKNIYSENNGHLMERSGFDNSWPNELSLFLISNVAINNFQNYDINGFGVIMLNNISSGSVMLEDFLTGALINENFVVQNNLLNE